MKTKRFLSILLSLVLVLGMLPGMSLTASAAGNTTEITPTNTSGTMTITLTISAPHTHSFTYSAEGDTITATCNGTGTCDVTEGLTLTISAPTGDLTADGTTTFPATLSTGYNTTAFPGEYPITYTKDGQPFDGTPTEAGEYTASVTVGDATASVSYTVTAATVPVTGVSLDKTDITIPVGSAEKLTATVIPGDATNKKVKWSVDGDKGIVALYYDENCTQTVTLDAETDTLEVYAKGLAAGGADSNRINVTSVDGSKNVGCFVTVSAPVTAKAIAAGESYYIGDSISFSDAPPFVYVRYDDDTYYGPSGATAYLIGGENTTVTAPTYSTRDGQWKFKDVLRYEPWASARPLNITGPADVTPLGFKCSGGTGTSDDPFTFECIYPAPAVPNFYSADETAAMFGTTAPENNDPETMATDGLFLGWYADADYTQPITRAEDIPETGAYARFIPTKSLGLGVQFRVPAKSGEGKTDLRLIATVPDSTLYSEIGFLVEADRGSGYFTVIDEHYNDSIYSDYVVQTTASGTSRYTLQDAIAANVGNAEWSTRITCCALLDMPNSFYAGDATTNFRVTQYIVTKDGTTAKVGAKEFVIMTGENDYPVALPIA